MKQKNSNTETCGKKITSKQIVAIGGIALLVLMYLGTLIVAIADQSASMALFQACLVATIAIPFLIWVYIWMYGKLTQKHTIADLDIGGAPHPSDSAQASPSSDCDAGRTRKKDR